MAYTHVCEIHANLHFWLSKFGNQNLRKKSSNSTVTELLALGSRGARKCEMHEAQGGNHNKGKCDLLSLSPLQNACG